MQLRISEGGGEERNGMVSSIFQESGWKEGRKEVEQSPAEALMDCSEFTRAVGAQGLWASARMHEWLDHLRRLF